MRRSTSETMPSCSVSPLRNREAHSLPVLCWHAYPATRGHLKHLYSFLRRPSQVHRVVGLDVLSCHVDRVAPREQRFTMGTLLFELLRRRRRPRKGVDASRTGHDLTALELLDLARDPHPGLREQTTDKPGETAIVVYDLKHGPPLQRCYSRSARKADGH